MWAGMGKFHLKSNLVPQMRKFSPTLNVGRRNFTSGNMSHPTTALQQMNGQRMHRMELVRAASERASERSLFFQLPRSDQSPSLNEREKERESARSISNLFIPILKVRSAEQWIDRDRRGGRSDVMLVKGSMIGARLGPT